MRLLVGMQARAPELRRRPLFWQLLPRLMAVGLGSGTFAATPAANDVWIDLNVGSKHSEKSYVWQGRTQSFNEANWGLGATYGLRDWCDVKAGWFENSYDKTSLYVLVNPKWELSPRSHWSVAPGFALGLVSGYQHTPERTAAVAPWGMLTLSLGFNERWRVNLGYIPSRLFVSNSIDVATLQLSIKL